MHLTFKTKKNGHEFLTFYIRPRSSVDSGQWDWGIKYIMVIYWRYSESYSFVILVSDLPEITMGFLENN